MENVALIASFQAKYDIPVVLLGLPAPRYHHHRLITDSAGKRLATRDKALSLRSLRAEGATPVSIRQQLGFD